MNKSEYQRIVNHNSKVLNKLLKKRSTDLSNIIFSENIKGNQVSFDTATSKAYDVLGCCSIGAIPTLAKSGADGYIWVDDEDTLHELEVKVCGIRHDNIYAGPKGGLYWSSNPSLYHNRASIKSRLQGSFDINMTEATLQTKSRLTSLICFDQTENTVIDAWIMCPTSTAEQLGNRKNNKTMTLKLSCFEKHGSPIKPTVNYVGWDNWFNDRLNDARQAERFICGR